MNRTPQWLFWALVSAVFAALMAICQPCCSGSARLGKPAAHRRHRGRVVGGCARHRQWSNPARLRPPRRVGCAVRPGLGCLLVFDFRALQRGQASQVAPVDKLSVLLVALFAVAFLHERLAWREWAGLAMTSGGVLRRALRR